MAYSLWRLPAAVCFLTVVLSPLGYVLWKKAKRNEEKSELELQQLREAN